MSRYPDESTARFDDQFAETPEERNARLRKKRLDELSKRPKPEYEIPGAPHLRED
jgi:hypothetical protein